MKQPKVFIGSSMNGIPIAQAVQNLLIEENFQITQLEGSFGSSLTTFNILRAIADEVDLAVFVFSYLDKLNHWNNQEQLRSNLIFEVGLFVGLLGLERVFLIMPDSICVPFNLDVLARYSYETPKNNNFLSVVKPAVKAILLMSSRLTKSVARKDEYFSCFISYSSHDKQFVNKLYEDLRNVGVRCWLDEKDLQIGESLVGQISRALTTHDKVLLVLSEASMKSEWVKKEIHHAISCETAENRLFLFPLSIDNIAFSSQGDNTIDLVRSKYIGDFRNWQEQSVYRKSFSRLVRDLAISSSKNAGSESHA